MVARKRPLMAVRLGPARRGSVRARVHCWGNIKLERERLPEACRAQPDRSIQPEELDIIEWPFNIRH